MTHLIVIVFWYAHALNIPFPIGYSREHLGELEQSYVLDYAHAILLICDKIVRSRFLGLAV